MRHGNVRRQGKSSRGTIRGELSEEEMSRGKMSYTPGILLVYPYTSSGTDVPTLTLILTVIIALIVIMKRQKLTSIRRSTQHVDNLAIRLTLL